MTSQDSKGARLVWEQAVGDTSAAAAAGSAHFPGGEPGKPDGKGSAGRASARVAGVASRAASRARTIRTLNLVFISGQGPIADGKIGPTDAVISDALHPYVQLLKVLQRFLNGIVDSGAGPTSVTRSKEYYS